jgi:hypothetical protein
MIQDRPPVRFQHLELTVPRGSLTQERCAEIDRFWCDVFGFESDDVTYPMYNNLRQHRIMADGQTFILVEADEPGQTFTFPHLGIQLASVEEAERLLAACQRFQETDDRVEIWDAGTNRFPEIQGLHRAFVVMYLMPMRFDIFAINYDPGHEQRTGWRYEAAARASS